MKESADSVTIRLVRTFPDREVLATFDVHPDRIPHVIYMRHGRLSFSLPQDEQSASGAEDASKARHHRVAARDLEFHEAQVALESFPACASCGKPTDLLLGRDDDDRRLECLECFVHVES